MSLVRAGVLSGQSEELIDGYVIWNDQDGIQASWSGLDPESGVAQYAVAVGTQPGRVMQNHQLLIVHMCFTLYHFLKTVITLSVLNMIVTNYKTLKIHNEARHIHSPSLLLRATLAQLGGHATVL